jgi:hypothetical protein
LGIIAKNAYAQFVDIENTAEQNLKIYTHTAKRTAEEKIYAHSCVEILILRMRMREIKRRQIK